jgi:plasmid stabilization system protein ParE
MLPIRWGIKAKADLAGILAYLRKRNQQAATDLLAEIKRAVTQLPQHPYLYRMGRVTNTREMVVHTSYVVVYRVGITAIEILAVLHSRRRYP